MTPGRSSTNRRGGRCSISCASAASKASASIAGRPPVAAAGALVHYLRGTQKVDLAHVRAIAYRQRADALLVDPTTLKHLEILEGSEGGRDGSLLDELDRTVTSIGSRLLRAWLLRPLVSLEPIRDRLDAVEELAFRTTERGKFRDTIKAVQDLERLVARAALGTAGPRDLVGLKQSLAVIPRVRTVLADLQAPLVRSLVAELDDLADVRDPIESTLIDDPPALARDGGFARDGFDRELDELRTISRSGKQVIAEMEERERARTGIASLKVRYNRVFGYYIEVSKSNLGAVPPDYHRKQTIAGGERFITPALKEYEEKVLGADERILERELEIFETLRAGGRRRGAAHSGDGARARRRSTSWRRSPRPPPSTTTSSRTSTTATSSSSSTRATRWSSGGSPASRSCRTTSISTARRVSSSSSPGRTWAASPPTCGRRRSSAIMAQAGSFVPAREAKLPLVDRIFARVGASDNIARGHSTFMVEMQETANILHTATSRSLVVLDEIGRGTATFDGLSIAWAVAEHLATNPKARPKTLFATHYHELTDLADATPGVVNFHVAAREWKDDIIFLRKIVAGRSDRSYGIQVARLAGLPPLGDRSRPRNPRGPRARRADARRAAVGQRHAERAAAAARAVSGAPGRRSPARTAGRVDVDRLTPLEALSLLAELKKDAGR